MREMSIKSSCRKYVAAPDGIRVVRCKSKPQKDTPIETVVQFSVLFFLAFTFLQTLGSRKFAKKPRGTR